MNYKIEVEGKVNTIVETEFDDTPRHIEVIERLVSLGVITYKDYWSSRISTNTYLAD